MEIINKLKRLLGRDATSVKVHADSHKHRDATRYDPDINIGLTQDKVNDRISEKLTNDKPINRTKSYTRIVLENVFNFCNTVTIILVALLFIAGAGMYAVSSVIVILNMAIGIWQEIKAKHKVEKLSIVIDNTCEVIRDGQHNVISTKQLVLDDIFITSQGMQLPVDSVIKSGIMEVDESILTGESRPVKKSVGDKVLAGSAVVSGEAVLRADKVGKDCYIENVARVARRVSKPKSNIFKILDRIIKGISVVLVFLAGLLLISLLVTGAESTFLIESGVALNEISAFQSYVITISAAILGMLPIGMFPVDFDYSCGVHAEIRKEEHPAARSVQHRDDCHGRYPVVGQNGHYHQRQIGSFGNQRICRARRSFGGYLPDHCRSDKGQEQYGFGDTRTLPVREHSGLCGFLRVQLRQEIFGDHFEIGNIVYNGRPRLHCRRFCRNERFCQSQFRTRSQDFGFVRI